MTSWTKELGRAVPYGVYDLANDEGWLSVGDTAEPLPSPSRPSGAGGTRWGAPEFPGRQPGPHHRRRRRVQRPPGPALEGRAGQAGPRDRPRDHGGALPTRDIQVEPIEHRMFSFISMNWRGRFFVSYRTIVELISATTTKKGLTIRAEEDLNDYEIGYQSQRCGAGWRAPHASTTSTATGTTRSPNQTFGEP